ACHDAYQVLPPAFGPYAGQTTFAAAPAVWILPYVEQDNLYNKIMSYPGGLGTTAKILANGDYANPPLTPAGSTFSDAVPVNITTYQCPSDLTVRSALATSSARLRTSYASYAANGLVFGKMAANSLVVTATSVTCKYADGTSYRAAQSVPKDI